MFDFGKITDAIGGLLSGQSQANPAQTGGITDLLAQAGIDPALLDGLSQEEIIGLLQQHGIDLGHLDPAQLSELFQGTDIAGNLSQMASDWLASRGR
jgi:hypothetical protein